MGIEPQYATTQHTEKGGEMSDTSSKDFTPAPPAMVAPPPHAEHGPIIDHKIPQEDAVAANPDLWWPRTRRMLREPFSEFFGVFILILFGDGVVAQVVLSDGKKGDFQSINWGWG